MSKRDLLTANARLARSRWGVRRDHQSFKNLQIYSEKYQFSIAAGDLLFMGRSWYVTHAGRLSLSHRKHCSGIQVVPVPELWNSNLNRFAFKAIVFTSHHGRGFVGFGDADPSNVSPFVRGAEMRIAETRAVNRALRKAYGIGICSVEEIGSFDETSSPHHPVRKLPPEFAKGRRGCEVDANENGTRVRDRLCQIIRQHQLDPNLLKAYATDFCAVKTLREATRQQVENFVAHLADWAEKDRNALLCQLNSYLSEKAGAA